MMNRPLLKRIPPPREKSDKYLHRKLCDSSTEILKGQRLESLMIANKDCCQDIGNYNIHIKNVAVCAGTVKSYHSCVS